MSNIKRSLPEDVDITDDRDSGNYGPDKPEDPSAIDFATNDLNNAIRVLEENVAMAQPYVEELVGYAARLQRVIKKAQRPF